MRAHLLNFLMVIAACLALGAASPGFACAIPSELIIQQQMLNFKNPNATHVMGATWTLQKAGKLDMPDPERIMARGAKRKEMDEAARLAALRAITELQAMASQQDTKDHAVSIVLVERMHRQRILTAGSRSRDPFSAKNDLLLVTTEPALHAMTKGKLSIKEGVAAGVVRIYGTDDQHSAFMKDYAHIGSMPFDSNSLSHLMPALGSSEYRIRQETQLKTPHVDTSLETVDGADRD